jgi:hypothetical protein
LGYGLEGAEGVSRYSHNLDLAPQDLADTDLPPFEACVRVRREGCVLVCGQCIWVRREGCVLVCGQCIWVRREGCVLVCGQCIWDIARQQFEGDWWPCQHNTFTSGNSEQMCAQKKKVVQGLRKQLRCN